MADFDDLAKLISWAIRANDPICQPIEAPDERDLVRALVKGKNVNPRYKKVKVWETVPVIQLPPNVEYVACQFCKKKNHASSHCLYNPAKRPTLVPCQHCKRTNHVTAKCWARARS